MRAIKINSEAQTVEVIDFEGDFEAIQKEIGVDCFTCVNLDNDGNTLYVDDEGLFKDVPFFRLSLFGQPLAGNGLILGTGFEGESSHATCEVPKVEFFTRNEIALMSMMGAL